ncbi:MAG: polysaccharide deacetylase family protein [Acidobacteriota bacterium]|nr:polysaccharide deacetylase family protein [Acidobacteriota bacterium]
MNSETLFAGNNRPAQAPAQVGRQPLNETPHSRIVTTSWDGGDPNDLRVAGLLAARKVAGTFYIPVKDHHKSCRMGYAEFLELDSQGFEIGSHGASHPNLPLCDKKQLTLEVDSCKKRLEDDLGKAVSMFAYPRGKYDSNVIDTLKQAGYAGGRTSALLASTQNFDPFRMPTTVQVFPHSRLDYLRNLAREMRFDSSWGFATHFRFATNWVELAKSLFDSVLKSGGLWHLYGRSWEIEELRLWGGLKEVLDYVSNRPGVLYSSNCGAIRSRTHRLTRTAGYTQPASDL